MSNKMSNQMNNKQPETMYDYSRLPTLVLNEIFGYLDLRERIKCKSVCHGWRMEIDLREKNRDLLILHFGPYLWNLKWSRTNNGGLMRFENSFEVKDMAILHPLAKPLLNIKRIKKLAIVNYHNSYDPGVLFRNVYSCIGNFNNLEELEIRNFMPYGSLAFDLRKLKRLVIKDSQIENLFLNCPSLEELVWNFKIDEIMFHNIKNLKRLICFNWPARVSLDGNFNSLEYLNLFIGTNQRVSDRLLDPMPKLKRLMLYSSDLKADLEIIRKQQARLRLKKLEILSFGFKADESRSELVELDVYGIVGGFVALDKHVDKLFDNYARLTEISPWKIFIEYSSLFDKFKILPANFFEHFAEPIRMQISKVTSYTHLFEFLRLCPFIEQLIICFSKVNGNLILDLIHLLQPSLRQLALIEDCGDKLLDIDLSFMLLFGLVFLMIESSHLPVEFIRKLVAKRGSRSFLRTITFGQSQTGYQVIIHFLPQGFALANNLNLPERNFNTIEQLISGMQNDPDLRTVLHRCYVV